MRKGLNNEQGITLIEVIASIVILSIILITFFPFLLQSTKFTKFNEEKLTAVSIAEEVVADLRFLKSPNELESLGFQLVGNDYINDESYTDYIVRVSFRDHTVSSNLRGAIISVTPTSDVNNRTSFKTEMFMEVGSGP